MGSFLAEEGSYVSLENKKFSLRSNLSVDLTKYITMNVNLDANQSNDKRFYWPFSDDDDQSVYDLYRCTFNAMKTTPFYSYLDGTPLAPSRIIRSIKTMALGRDGIPWIKWLETVI